MKYLIVFLALLAGLGQPVQVAANKQLRELVASPALAAWCNYAIGLAVATVLAATGLLGANQLGNASGAPWWAWAGGFFGVLSVTTGLVALGRMSAAR